MFMYTPTYYCSTFVLQTLFSTATANFTNFIANYRRSKRIKISAKKEQIFWSLLSKAAKFQFSAADLSYSTSKPECVNFLILWKYFLRYRRYFTLWSNSWPLLSGLFKRSVLPTANTNRLMKYLKLSRRINVTIYCNAISCCKGKFKEAAGLRKVAFNPTFTRLVVWEFMSASKWWLSWLHVHQAKTSYEHTLLLRVWQSWTSWGL
jgi:hypothetical protein